MYLSSVRSRGAPSRSALLTTRRSAASSRPAFIVWMPSPDSGTSTTTVVSASLDDVELGLPHAHRLDEDPVEPAASRSFCASAVARASPPRLPRVAMLRMNTPGSSVCACIRIRSPRTAPPVKGLVGSTATTPTVAPLFRIAAVSRSTSVLFPAPGGPVIPTV